MCKKRTDYDANIRCGNCGYEGQITLKKGIRISQAQCPNCGCLEVLHLQLKTLPSVWYGASTPTVTPKWEPDYPGYKVTCDNVQTISAGELTATCIEQISSSLANALSK